MSTNIDDEAELLGSKLSETLWSGRLPEPVDWSVGHIASRYRAWYEDRCARVKELEGVVAELTAKLEQERAEYKLLMEEAREHIKELKSELNFTHGSYEE